MNKTSRLINKLTEFYSWRELDTWTNHIYKRQLNLEDSFDYLFKCTLALWEYKNETPDINYHIKEYRKELRKYEN